MKTKRIFLILLVFVLICSGCSSQSDYTSETKQITMEVYNCLLNGDSEKLEGLFCEFTRNSPNFDYKFRRFMSSIGGRIVSGDIESYHYDVPIRRRDVGTDYNDYDFLQTLAFVDNVKDTNGKCYQLLVSYIYRDSDNPDKVGLYAILLTYADDHYTSLMIVPDEE